MSTRLQVEAIFFDALEQNQAERSGYLSFACGGDTELRRKVERLLDAHPQATDFLAEPAVNIRDFERSDIVDPNWLARTVGTSERDTVASDPLAVLEPSSQTGSLARLTHYEILEVLGKGSFGTVFKAFDEKLHRFVAIKVMSPCMAASAVARMRFAREARLAAAIRQENVVAIYAVDDQPIPFLVMEYVAGQTLQQRLDELGRLDLPTVLRIGHQIACGLAAAHARGLVHRDIKPGNILLDSSSLMDKHYERVTITDFGLARAADDCDGGPTGLSGLGFIAGTPMYMAPEQARCETIDQRADMFSLGSVLYLMCCGQPPFQATSTVALLKRVAEVAPRPIQELNPEVPDWLCDLIGQLHAKNPDDRFSSAHELAKLFAQRLDELRVAGTVQAPPDVAAVAPEETVPQQFSPTARTASSRFRLGRRHGIAAAVFLILAATLVFAEATGVSAFQSTIIRLFSPEGSLVVEIDDPGVSVKIDGSELVITGAGAKEIRLKPGRHQVEASKDGKLVRRELITVTTNERQILRVTQEAELIASTDKNASSVVRSKLPPTFKNSIGMEFVVVPKGKSWLGGNKDKLGRPVEIQADFYLGKYEVTQEEWEKVMGENPSRFSRDHDNAEAVQRIKDEDLKRFPVEFVSWEECQRFLTELNSREKEAGWVYRLPTEFEWEYACRGGPMSDQDESAFDFYFAKPTNTLLPEHANFGRRVNRPRNVGSYEANVLGLHDMHGNVWEWCDSTYQMTRRVYKGGDWLNTSEYCRASAFYANPPTHRDTLLGLRVARVRTGS